jgi:hypothetical protein
MPSGNPEKMMIKILAIKEYGTSRMGRIVMNMRGMAKTTEIQPAIANTLVAFFMKILL